jgi:hypothetical protein
MVIGSDINGDNSWGGPGEMSGTTANFEITDANINDLAISLSPELVGVANTSPVITSTPIRDAYVNQLYFYPVRATDEDGDNLNYSMEVINNSDGEPADFISINQSGRVGGTPREDDAGEYSISIIVTDGVDAAVQEYVLTVNE